MSGLKTKCPSCGSEWDGPVVFCGECGTPVSHGQGERASSPSSPTSSGDRVARLPPPTPPPPRPSSDESVAVVHDKTIGGGPKAEAPRPRAPNPPEPYPADLRRTAVGLNMKPTMTMPAVVPPAAGAAPPDRDAKHAKGAARRRKSLPAIHVEPQGPEETQRILDDLDAGFDSIVRPSELPVPPASSPSSARMTVPMGLELFEPPPSQGTPATVGPPTTQPEPAVARPSAEPAADPAPTSAPISLDLSSSERAREAGSAASPEAPEARAARHEADMAHVRALFAEMAVAHARPLRDFMIEVTWGEPSKEWLEVATPAVTGLRRASEQLEMPELAAALEGVAAAIELAAGEAAIDREVKDLVTGAYAKLVEAMPAAFALDGERGQREPIIVRSLLLQVPGVRKVALDRIWAAGLTSLSMLYAARARDLAEATGIDGALAAAIVDKIQDHRRTMADLSPGKERANERAGLSALVAELERANEAYEQAAKAWGAGAAERKAAARKDREDVMLRIDVALAHLGEVDRQRALQKLPFQQKIRELYRYLEDARP